MTRDAVVAISGPVTTEPTHERVARRIEITGVVQGVGFRPFVWRLATALGLAGSVRNIEGRVEIVAAGDALAMSTFLEQVRSRAPMQARVCDVHVCGLSAQDVPRRGFAVDMSAEAPAGRPGATTTHGRLFPPDLALCEQCLRELFDPNDRRYRYPFLNCTDCGPRASIIDKLPYDRQRTTMSDFPMCEACTAEYHDPGNRRFHAEPIACPVCGPALAWHRVLPATGQLPDPATHRVGEDGLGEAVDALRAGEIVAVKGLGGYHLVCDATNDATVCLLRERKRRWAKPFAVMLPDLQAVAARIHLDTSTRAALTSPSHPIVLTDPRRGAQPSLSPSVLAGVTRLGVFLPYTGIHHLLLRDVGRPLVVTSGNRADEPIATDDREAGQWLTGIADGFLTHDRRIRSRYEDSVVAVVNGRTGLIRRGRGYAPAPIALPVAASEPVLALGAQLKHTFTLADGEHAHVGAHTGDLADVATFDAFRANLAHLCELLEVEPAWVAHDRHPEYLSSKHAQTWPSQRRLAIQHHHAHVASCAAEHGVSDPVIGVALDGLGLGDDATLWGGEFFVCDLTGYRRVARFGRALLPGGEAAIRQPWRMALGYLFSAEGGDWCEPALARTVLDRFPTPVTSLLRRQLAAGINCPVASSAGRLFDAASSILGCKDEARYEGEAAIALEQAADPDEGGTLPYEIIDCAGMDVYDPRSTLHALLSGAAGAPGRPGRLAARFQRTIATVVSELAARAAAQAGLDVVCLSGGVWQNRWLLTETTRQLRERGLTPLSNERVPPNDGGISYGQAAVAAACLAERVNRRPDRRPDAADHG